MSCLVLQKITVYIKSLHCSILKTRGADLTGGAPDPGKQSQDDNSNNTHPVILSQVSPGNPNYKSAKDREQIYLNPFHLNLNLQAGA